MTLPKPCVVCGKLNRDGKPRCPQHQKPRRRNLEAEKRRERNRTGRGRGTDPERKQRYDADWRKTSKQRRAANPWCQSCGVDESVPGGLTVDHGTLWVLCRSCHGRLEARRRAEAKRAKASVSQRD